MFRVDTHNLAWRALRWGGRSDLGRQVAAAAGQEHGRHQAAARSARARAACRHDGPIDGINESLRRGLAARVRADGVELHHRPVDHVGADARGLRDAGVGAAAAQELDCARCASIT